MARFLVLLKFNSQANADLFMANPYNSSVLGATQATVESGFIGPSGPSTGLGQPSSAPSSGYTYVDIYVPSISSIPKGYYTGPNSPSATQLILDLNTRIPVYISPNIDPNSITLKEGDNTIINNGIPNPDWTPPDPTVDSPIEFKPIYYPNENPDDFYKQYLRLISDVPSDPNVMKPDPEYHDPFNPLDPANQALPEIFPRPERTPEDVTVDPSYDPMAPYDDTPFPTPPPFEFNLEPVPAPPKTTTPFDDSPVDVPPPREWEVPVDPQPFFPIPQPFQKISVEGSGGGAPPAAWGCVRGTSPNQPQIFILDDSCSVYNSSNGGNNFCTILTPGPTIGDNWIAMSVPTNDASSPVPSVMALFDEDVNATYSPAIFDSTRGGVQVIRSGQTPLTAPILNYSKGTVGVNYLSGELGGAISSNGTILIPVSQSDNIAAAYPRISTDFGATFSDVTGLPIGQQWTCACFSQNAAVMYIHQYQSHIQKSTNGGTTWTSLSASPTFPSTHGVTVPGLTQKSMKLFCSKDGLTVAGVDWGGQFYVSRDGGTTWTSFDFPTLYIKAPGNPNNVASGDFGMSTDGTRFLVMIGYIIFGFPNVNKAVVLTSSDGGITWVERTTALPPFFGTGLFSHCSLSPDGSAGVVGCDTTGEVATTVDYGVTWAKKSYTVNPVSGGNNQNSYVLPAGSIS